MSWVLNFWGSAVGKKAVMAVSGIVLFAYVLLHMMGNLKVYQGPEAFNHYAEGLRVIGDPLFPRTGLLWIVRVVLLVSVALHILAAYQLTVMNWAARPVGYAQRDSVQAGYASFTMRWSGIVIALFVIYHLAHLTFGWGWAHPDFDPNSPYHNFVVGFRSWIPSAAYMVAQVALGFHLYHGLWSMFQSMGWNHPRFNHWRRGFAQVFAIAITAGNLSFPIAVLTGVVS